MQKQFKQQVHNSSVYQCQCCQRQTRETGLGESGCDLCAFCYEVSGFENSLSDGAVTRVEFEAGMVELERQYGARAHIGCVGGN